MIVKFDSFSSKYEDYSKFNIFLFHGSNEGKVVECKNYVLSFRKIREREREVINIYSSEMKSEDFFTEHGLSDAKEHDVKDEMSFLEEEEEVDYDADENEVNMDEISPHMREVYEKD